MNFSSVGKSIDALTLLRQSIIACVIFGYLLFILALVPSITSALIVAFVVYIFRIPFRVLFLVALAGIIFIAISAFLPDSYADWGILMNRSAGILFISLFFGAVSMMFLQADSNRNAIASKALAPSSESPEPSTTIPVLRYKDLHQDKPPQRSQKPPKVKRIPVIESKEDTEDARQQNPKQEKKPRSQSRLKTNLRRTHRPYQESKDASQGLIQDITNSKKSEK